MKMSANERKVVKSGRGPQGGKIRYRDHQDGPKPGENTKNKGGAPKFVMTGEDGRANNYSTIRQRVKEHAIREFGEIGVVVSTLEYPKNKRPAYPTVLDDDGNPEPSTDPIDLADFNLKSKDYVARGKTIRDNKPKLYGFLMESLSTKSLRAVEKHKDFERAESLMSPRALMKIIHGVHLLGVTKVTEDDVIRIQKAYTNVAQASNEPDGDYIDRFKSECNRYNALQDHLNNAKLSDKQKATHFIQSLNSKRHNHFKLRYKNGDRTYPDDLADAIEELDRFTEPVTTSDNSQELKVIRNAFAAIGKKLKSGHKRQNGGGYPSLAGDTNEDTGSKNKNDCWTCGMKGVRGRCPVCKGEKSSKHSGKGFKQGNKGTKSDRSKQPPKSIKEMVRELASFVNNNDESDYGSDADTSA